MRSAKRRLWGPLFMVVALALVVTACGSQPTQPAKPAEKAPAAAPAPAPAPAAAPAPAPQSFVLKLGHPDTAEGILGMAIAKAAIDIEKKTNGRLKLQVFPFTQLGGEREMMEMVQLGTLDLQSASEGITGSFIDAFKVFNMPFIASSRGAFNKFMDSDSGKQLLKSGESKGFVGIMAALIGNRNVTNNVRPITKPEDFKGINMRTQQNEVHIDTMKAMGANATPIPFPELYTALQTGVVQGEYNDYNAIVERKFYEVQKFVTEIPLFTSVEVVFASKKTWDKLPDDLKKVLVDEFMLVRKTVDDNVPKKDAEDVKVITAAGKAVNKVEGDAVKPFVAATAGVHKKYMESTPAIKPYLEALTK